MRIRMPVILTIGSCVWCASGALAQNEPAAATDSTAPAPPPTYPGPASGDNASNSEEEAWSEFVPEPPEAGLRYGVSLGLEAARAFGEHVGGGQAGFSAALAVLWYDSLHVRAQLGVTVWPTSLRLDSALARPSQERKPWSSSSERPSCRSISAYFSWASSSYLPS